MVLTLIHGSVQFRRQSIDQIRSEFFQSKLFQYYYIILNNLSSVIGVIQFLLKSLNDKSRCTINKYVTGYVTSNQIKMFQFCLIDIMSSTLWLQNYRVYDASERATKVLVDTVAVGFELVLVEFGTQNRDCCCCCFKPLEHSSLGRTAALTKSRSVTSVHGVPITSACALPPPQQVH